MQGTRLLAAVATTCLVLLPLDRSAAQTTSEEPPAQSGGDAAPADDAVEPVAPPAKAPPPDDGKPRAQPSPEDIIKAFEQDRPVNKPASARRWRESAAGSLGGTAKQNTLSMREGDFIHNMAGRVTRDGPWWTFIFESDSAEAPLPPMRLLPNQQLERLVLETAASNQRPVFVMSGEVTLFESRNYVLIRKALRRRPVQDLEK